MSLVLVFGVPVELRGSVIFGWVWLGDFSSDACKIRLCLRRWQFGGAPDVRALANLELSSASPLLMSRMKMVQLSKWQLVPPIPCGIAALSSFIYRQFLLRLRSSLASWPTLHSSATNWFFMYYEKYGAYTQNLNRGGLKIPEDSICQWSIFSYIMFEFRLQEISNENFPRYFGQLWIFC